MLVKTRKNMFDLHEGYQVRFLVGNTNRSEEKSHPRLIKNFQRYIIGDYDDRYENLHFKTFTAFQFVSLCSVRNSNIIFIDDDTFFDPIQKILPAPITCGHERNNAETTWKKPFGKYYLSNDVWPDNYRYPTYCAGACTVLRSSAAQKIYNVARKIELNEFNIDDVLFTGVYRELANIPVPSVKHNLCHHFTGDYNALLTKFRTYDSKINTLIKK
ncbi:unnamed protein product [Oikopleura dioica]|uniref:Hexosyltransferase n=1 Tax=Oikopleura dioica TaxID=34765 RepID=E4YBP7_OIKDI|nr:unnamed protein product [Oikopleura dioica]